MLKCKGKGLALIQSHKPHTAAAEAQTELAYRLGRSPSLHLACSHRAIRSPSLNFMDSAPVIQLHGLLHIY